MSDQLRFRLEVDSDGSGELFVEAACKAYAGASSAWFGVQQLRDFGRELQETFPIPPDTPIELEGGFWSSASPNALEQCHVGLRFYPVGASGRIGIRVSLATPVHHGDRKEAQSVVSFELSTYYESLRQFGEAVRLLAEGQIETAELNCAAS